MVIWASGLRELLQFVGLTLSVSAGAVVVGWFRREAQSEWSFARVLKAGAAAFFLAATPGMAIATLAMGTASAFAAAVLISCGLAAHAFASEGRTP